MSDPTPNDWPERRAEIERLIASQGLAEPGYIPMLRAALAHIDALEAALLAREREDAEFYPDAPRCKLIKSCGLTEGHEGACEVAV
jgi:hypothetical protein